MLISAGREAWLLCVGFGLGLGAALVLTPGCVIPDSCPVIATKGTNWCLSMQDAQMWPPGQPELAEPVVGQG